jgi:hypothetical protein
VKAADEKLTALAEQGINAAATSGNGEPESKEAASGRSNGSTSGPSDLRTAAASILSFNEALGALSPTHRAR